MNNFINTVRLALTDFGRLKLLSFAASLLGAAFGTYLIAQAHPTLFVVFMTVTTYICIVGVVTDVAKVLAKYKALRFKERVIALFAEFGIPAVVAIEGNDVTADLSMADLTKAQLANFEALADAQDADRAALASDQQAIAGDFAKVVA